MRFIEKRQAPDALTQWLAEEVPQNRTYSNMPTDVKGGVRQALWTEQYRLCAYTMIRLEKHTDCHIEHFSPRNPPRGTPRHSEGDDVYYGNMLACYPAPGKECSFGARRRENRTLSISPLEQRCEASVHYLANGEVEGLDEDARRAIDLLNLNDPMLKSDRAAKIQARGLVLSPDVRYGEIELLSVAEAFALAREILRPIDGLLVEFCVAISQVAKDYARACLANG